MGNSEEKTVEESYSGSTVITPTKEVMDELMSQDLDLVERSSLIIVNDLLKIDEHQDGYVAVKRDGLRINNEFYDIAAGHVKSEKEMPYFYNIPIGHCDSDAIDDVLNFVFEQFCKAGKNRYFVSTPEHQKPYLVDVHMNGGIRIGFAPYSTTTFDKALTEGEGHLFKERVEAIAKELSRS